ncbi:hypothetical protein GmHk_09G025770 [Glycine max]|nr:hypothetical protein GmHk_09G025770 [Glycine max]
MILGPRDNKLEREVCPAEDFTIKLDERWYHSGKFQKLHMSCSYVVAACKHAHYEYTNYISLVYMLESVFNVYTRLFRELHNEAYLPPCHAPMICPDPEKKRSTKVRPVSSCIHTEMDIQELGQPKLCSMCIPGHSKKNCLHYVGSSQQH